MEEKDCERIAILETKVLNHESQICEMGKDIKEIKDKLLGRPTWQITAVISVLATACGSMVMFILTRII